MWHLQGSDSQADSLHQSQDLCLALLLSQLRGGSPGAPGAGGVACGLQPPQLPAVRQRPACQALGSLG